MTTSVPKSLIGLQPSGSDDTSAAQAALSSGSLHFAAGVFSLSAALTIPNNAVITAAVGDRVEQSVPVVGQPKGWRCTVAGSPGTWVSEGNL